MPDTNAIVEPCRSGDTPTTGRESLSDLFGIVRALHDSRDPRRLKLLGMLLAILIAIGTGYAVKAQYDEVSATTTREIESLAFVLAHQADRTLQAVELVQKSILDRIGPVDSPEAFRAALTGREFHEDLRQRISGLPQVDAVTAIDASGNLVNFSRYWPIPQVNISDRDYFRVLEADLDRRTFISVPVRNRGDGKWTAYLARSVVSRDGVFLGLILAGLDLGYFEELYRDAGLPAHSSIALFRDDGVLLARHPEIERSAEPRQRLRDSLRLARSSIGARGVVYTVDAGLDGVARIAAAVPLTNYPLGVTVSVSRTALLAHWLSLATVTVTAGLLLELTVLGIAILVTRQMRAQARLAEANLYRGHAEAELATAWAHAEAERAARERDARYVLALNSLSQGLCMFDTADQLSLMNHRFEAMFGLAHGTLRIGMSAADVFASLVGPTRPGEVCSATEILAHARAALEAGEIVSFVQDHVDGRAWSVSMVPEGNGGWLATFEDVSERRRMEAKATFLARHDSLTGLANRTLFRERLEAALARSREGVPFALLSLDLDRFKWVNDTLGHPAGDALLRSVTERLRAHCRPTDTICRLGGDEFAVIQHGPVSERQAVLLAERLIEAVTSPYALEGQEVRIGTSIGIALVPQDGDEPMTLLKRVDLALYQAKKERGTYCLFTPALEHAARIRPSLEAALRNALETGEFEVVYQPILDLHSGRLEGLEALLRWHHPERGLVSPGEFIPLAEEIGLVRHIDAWVLRRACADATTWPDGLRLSVNLSPQHFQEQGPAGLVRAVLDATHFPPHRLELEITETATLDAGPAVQDMMRSLKALGVRLAVDDLGAGHSRLEYLRSFPLDTVKIDKSIVDDVTSAEKSRAIIDALGALCGRLGLSCTVEGVETEEQLRELQLSPCTSAQGFLFGRPQPAADVAELCMRFGVAGTLLPEAGRVAA